MIEFENYFQQDQTVFLKEGKKMALAIVLTMIKHKKCRILFAVNKKLIGKMPIYCPFCKELLI